MHAVIPIHDEHACGGRQPLRVLPPRLSGPQPQVGDLMQALANAISAPGGPLQPEEPVGGWLRALHLEPGLADVLLAAELGCRGELVATLAFDVLRGRLPDTDIFVSLEKPAAQPQCRSA